MESPTTFNRGTMFHHSKVFFKDVPLETFSIFFSRHPVHYVKPFSSILYEKDGVFYFRWHPLEIIIFSSMPKVKIIYTFRQFARCQSTNPAKWYTARNL
jgi:hypothetical protein